MSRSVFGKLLAIMITMAVALLALVTWFFMFKMLPAMKHSAEPFVVATIQRIAQARPNLAEVKRMTAESRLDIAVRYEGPDGTWSTSPWLPPKKVANRTVCPVGSRLIKKPLPDPSV